MNEDRDPREWLENMNCCQAHIQGRKKAADPWSAIIDDLDTLLQRQMTNVGLASIAVELRRLHELLSQHLPEQP